MEPFEGRVKTDVRLPAELLEVIEQLSALTGLPKNAFLTMAAALLVARLAPVIAEDVARERVLEVVKREFQKLMQQASV